MLGRLCWLIGWNKRAGKWISKAVIRGKKYQIGLFQTAEEASEAYQSFAKQHHEEFYNA